MFSSEIKCSIFKRNYKILPTCRSQETINKKKRTNYNQTTRSHAIFSEKKNAGTFTTKTP